MLGSNLQTYQHSRWSLKWIRNSSCCVSKRRGPGDPQRDKRNIIRRTRRIYTLRSCFFFSGDGCGGRDAKVRGRDCARACLRMCHWWRKSTSPCVSKSGCGWKRCCDYKWENKKQVREDGVRERKRSWGFFFLLFSLLIRVFNPHYCFDFQWKDQQRWLNSRVISRPAACTVCYADILLWVMGDSVLVTTVPLC